MFKNSGIYDTDYIFPRHEKMICVRCGFILHIHDGDGDGLGCVFPAIPIRWNQFGTLDLSQFNSLFMKFHQSKMEDKHEESKV